MHKSTICRSITSGYINVCHKGGRPRLTTDRDRKVAVFFKKNPVATVKEPKNDIILNISTRTVQRRAVDHDLSNYTRTNKPFVSERTENCT